MLRLSEKSIPFKLTALRHVAVVKKFFGVHREAPGAVDVTIGVPAILQERAGGCAAAAAPGQGTAEKVLGRGHGTPSLEDERRVLLFGGGSG